MKGFLGLRGNGSNNKKKGASDVNLDYHCVNALNAYTVFNSLNETSKNDFSKSYMSNGVVNKPVKDRVKKTSGSKVIGYTFMINEPATENEKGMISLSAKRILNIKCLKVNLRSLDKDKPTNVLDEVQIPLSLVLEVYSRFEYILYGYFVGKRVAFVIVENYMRNAWKKCEDGLSDMDTRMGNPIMLDSYTSSICMQSWGRLNYARALIDIRVDRELKEIMVIVVQCLEGNRDMLHTVRV
ncbi:hypothetical protein Tco_1572035 [Tanacetum coccineum]